MHPELDVLGVHLRLFAVAFVLAFVASELVMATRLRELGRPRGWASEICLCGLVAGVVGARAWYLASEPGRLLDDPVGSMTSGGGLTWYGGFLLATATILAWSRWRGLSARFVIDLASPAMAVGYAVGRIGCQLSGDGDYGKPWDGPWAMPYPDGVVPTDVPVHPAPIYETLAMGLVGLALWHARDRLAPGLAFAWLLVGAGLERFLVEFVRRNPPGPLGLTLAQDVSLVVVALGLALLVVWRPRTEPQLEASTASGREHPTA